MLRFFPAPRDERETEFEPKRFLKSINPRYEVSGTWKPLKVEGRVPPKVLFVDGVRRTEFRSTIFDGNRFVGEGIFISIGAGVLEVDLSTERPSYNLLESKVGRYFIHHLEERVEVPPLWEVFDENFLLRFESVHSPLRDLGKTANYLMKRLEIEVAKSYLRDDRLLIMDGTVKTSRFYPSVAYLVKEQKNFYLQGMEQILFDLKEGERTPIFLFEERTTAFKDGKPYEVSVKKLASYVRISGQFGDPTAGLVRIELPYTENVKDAVETVERAAAAAILFANDPLRDRRAPQNLTSIAFLERELRRYLGKYELVRRKILGLLKT